MGSESFFVEEDLAETARFSLQDLSRIKNDSTAKQSKALIATKENGDSKAEGEGNKATEQSIKPEPPKDYIHVRARRGQAKDSHSLAERARREKMNERMRILQDLVPGCNKVIGKALVLDEIINYIQSLQRQVEFLSMKLEAVNSKMGPVIEGFHPKEMRNSFMVRRDSTLYQSLSNHVSEIQFGRFEIKGVIS